MGDKPQEPKRREWTTEMHPTVDGICPECYSVGYEAAEIALEATIATLKAQLEAAEAALRRIAEERPGSSWRLKRIAAEALSAPASDTVGDCPFCGKEDWHPVDGYLGRFRCYSCGKWDVPASDTGSEEK